MSLFYALDYEEICSQIIVLIPDWYQALIFLSLQLLRCYLPCLHLELDLLWLKINCNRSGKFIMLGALQLEFDISA